MMLMYHVINCSGKFITDGGFSLIQDLSAHSSQGLGSECSALLERARHLAHTTATAAMAAVTATAIMMRTILSRLRTDN